MKPPDTILLPIDTRDCPLEAFSYINQFAFHEPLQFERCCGWSPTQPRSVEEQVHGPNARAERNVASHHRTVILLHVVNLNVVPPDGRVFDDLSRAAEKNLLRLSERFLDRRFFVRHQIRFGGPAQEILNEARESNVDLITLISHGSGSFWKRFHARIVQKVLRAAPCDVILLHARTRFNCDEDWERADEIVSSIDHAGLLPARVQSLV